MNNYLIDVELFGPKKTALDWYGSKRKALIQHVNVPEWFGPTKIVIGVTANSRAAAVDEAPNLSLILSII